MRRHFEFQEGTSSKFWDVEISNATVTTWWGKIGTNGQSKSKDFDSSASAQKEYDKLIAEKTKNGYKEVEAGVQTVSKAKVAAENKQFYDEGLAREELNKVLQELPAMRQRLAQYQKNIQDMRDAAKLDDSKNENHNQEECNDLSRMLTIDECWEFLEAKVGGRSALPEGVPEEVIREAESAMCVELPDDFRKFLQRHNGSGAFSIKPYKIGGGSQYFMAIKDIVGMRANMAELGARFEGKEDFGEQDGPIKENHWNKSWIPFTENQCGDHIFIDLDPPEEGTLGQVVDWWHETALSTFQSDSLREWLNEVVSEIKNGEYKFGGIGADDDEDEDEDDDAVASPSGRRHFECNEGNSSKFWEIELGNCRLTTYWGKIGTAGQSKILEFDSEAETKKQYDKLVAEKTKKGYQEIG